MRIVSFNINSVRARIPQVEAIIKIHDPDVIGLQETKVHDDEYPHEAIEALGYKSIIHGQKGHYGVALLSKKTPSKNGKGFKNDDEESQRRFIWGEYNTGKNSILVLNGYFPQGEERNHPIKFPAKEKFLELNIDNRKTEKENKEAELLAMENDLRKEIGLNTFESYQAFLDREEIKEEPDINEEILLEAANILSDFIKYSYKPVISMNKAG